MRNKREKIELKGRQERKENLSYKWKKNTVIALEKNDNINLKWKTEKNSSQRPSIKEKYKKLKLTNSFKQLQQRERRNHPWNQLASLKLTNQ